MHNRNLFSHSSGAWRSEIRPPARRGSGEQTAAFPLCPHLADRDMNSGPSSHKDATDPGRFSSDLRASLTFHSFSLSPSPSAVPHPQGRQRGIWRGHTSARGATSVVEFVFFVCLTRKGAFLVLSSATAFPLGHGCVPAVTRRAVSSCGTVVPSSSARASWARFLQLEARGEEGTDVRVLLEVTLPISGQVLRGDVIRDGA